MAYRQLDYGEFRARLEARFGHWGAINRFSEITGVHRVAVSRWGLYVPPWVSALMDAWDEIDRLRAMVAPPDTPPWDYQLAPDTSKRLPKPKKGKSKE